MTTPALDPISAFTPLGGAAATNDLLIMVDVSDPTGAATGTTKNMTIANVFQSPSLINFPAAQVFASTVASVQRTPVSGLCLQGATGSASDLVLVGADGNNVLSVPTGTHNLLTASALTVSGTLVALGTTTFADVAILANNVALQARDTTAGPHAILVLDGSNIINVGDFSSSFATKVGGTTVTLTGAALTTSTLGVAGKLTVGASAAANVVVAGGGAALATNATVGFLMFSAANGPPTGVPASIPTGCVVLAYDTSANKFYVYNGSWRSTSALT